MSSERSAPKVSVCVVTYNQARYLRECLQSIVDQRVDFEMEVIVGDDCSTDGAHSIIAEYAQRYPLVVRPLLHPRNIGPTGNYLAAHNVARGEYVCQCDGDDYWLPGKLATQVAIMDQNRNAVQSWHRQYLVDVESKITGVFPKRFPRAIFGGPLRFIDLAHSYGVVGQHSSHMYRRAARTVRERDRLTIDYFFALDIACRGDSLYLPEFLGCYRVAANASMTQSTTGRNAVDLAVLDAVEYFAKRFPLAEPALRANLSVRALGACLRRRPNWRVLASSARRLRFGFGSLIRSLLIFASSKV